MHWNPQEYWDAVLRQDGDAIRAYFHPDAWVNWHNTNEHFMLEEFIRANCEYPGDWDGQVEKILSVGSQVITVTHVFSRDGKLSFHVVSFLRVTDGRIRSIEEYWGDDGLPPQWRQEKGLGVPIPPCQEGAAQ